MNSEHAVTKRAYRISEMVRAFGIGRSTIYDLIAKGRLETMKSGKITLIPATSIDDWERASREEARKQESLRKGASKSPYTETGSAKSNEKATKSQ